MRKYVVDNLLVDPDGNEVSKDGQIIRLEPKTMSLLTLLAENAGKTISKEDIFQQVWPGMIVSEDSITRCISQLRKIFNDDPQNPRVIETIPRKGYRMKLPVQFIDNETRNVVTNNTGNVPQKRKISPWLAGAVAALIAALLVYGQGSITWGQGWGIVLASFSLVYVIFFYLNRR